MVAISGMNAQQLAVFCQGKTKGMVGNETRKKIEMRLDELAKQVESDFNDYKVARRSSTKESVHEIKQDIADSKVLMKKAGDVEKAITAFRGKVLFKGKRTSRLDNLQKSVAFQKKGMEKRITSLQNTRLPKARQREYSGKIDAKEWPAKLMGGRKAVAAEKAKGFAKEKMEVTAHGRLAAKDAATVSRELGAIRSAYPDINDPDVKAKISINGTQGIKDRIGYLKDQMAKVEGSKLSPAVKKALINSMKNDIGELKRIAAYKFEPAGKFGAQMRSAREWITFAGRGDSNSSPEFLARADQHLAAAKEHLAELKARGGLTESELQRFGASIGQTYDTRRSVQADIKSRSKAEVAELRTATEAHNSATRATVDMMKGDVINGIKGAVELAYAVRSEDGGQTVRDFFNGDAWLGGWAGESNTNAELRALGDNAVHYRVLDDGTHVKAPTDLVIASAENAIRMIERSLADSHIHAANPVRADVKAVKTQLDQLKGALNALKDFSDFETRDAIAAKEALEHGLAKSTGRGAAAGRAIEEGLVAQRRAALGVFLTEYVRGAQMTDTDVTGAADEVRMQRLVELDEALTQPVETVSTGKKGGVKHSKDVSTPFGVDAYQHALDRLEKKQADRAEGLARQRAVAAERAAGTVASDRLALKENVRLGAIDAGLAGDGVAIGQADARWAVGDEVQAHFEAGKAKDIRQMGDLTNEMLRLIKDDENAWYQLGSYIRSEGAYQGELNALLEHQPSTPEEAHAHFEKAFGLASTAFSRAYGGPDQVPPHLIEPFRHLMRCDSYLMQKYG